MATSRGKQLAEIIGQKVAALKQVCQGVDENLAARAPVDRWSPKEILSHLCGPERKGHLPLLRAFVDGDCPRLVLDAGNPFYTEQRAATSFVELVAECELNYRRVADFAAGLTDVQLARTAHIPELKDSPLGEYPTLDGMIYGLGEYHIQFHIDHLGEILAALQIRGEPNQLRIGIIGAGNIGGTLARHLTRLGHLVSIANSRGAESLIDLANEIGAKAVSVTEAAKAGEVVIISIPTKAVVDLPQGLFANVSADVIVVDTGNYHPELRDGQIEAIDRGMPDSQWVAQQVGRPVIKAFNTIFARSLLEKGAPQGTQGQIALSVFGDSVAGKATVLRLIDDLGFDPVDGGNLDNSWRQQAGTPAYCQDLEAAALRQALAEAVPERVAAYRAAEEARIRKYLAALEASG